MVVGEEDLEMMVKVIPSRKVLNFDVLEGPLSSEINFRNEIQQIVGEESLPLVFPNVPEYFKARNQGFVTNEETRDGELSFPKTLYDAETYSSHPELRVPMEELILEYEKERVKQGLPPKDMVGEEWSPSFLDRLHKVQNVTLSDFEISEGYGHSNQPYSVEKLNEKLSRTPAGKLIVEVTKDVDAIVTEAIKMQDRIRHRSSKNTK